LISLPFVLALPIGHSKAVRDICFNTSGTQFLSAAYDRYLKLWDTETGKSALILMHLYLLN
jgi:WD40 repeat protein